MLKQGLSVVLFWMCITLEQFCVHGVKQNMFALYSVLHQKSKTDKIDAAHISFERTTTKQAI